MLSTSRNAFCHLSAFSLINPIGNKKRKQPPIYLFEQTQFSLHSKNVWRIYRQIRFKMELQLWENGELVLVLN